MNPVFERALRWMLPVLIIAEVILVRGGILNVQAAVSVVLSVEGLLVLVGGAQILRAIRRYRRDRSVGLDVWAALEHGFAVFLPQRVARLAVLEAQLWTSLVTWLFRRRRPRAHEFTYHKHSLFGAFLLAALLSSPVEILLFELLVPWVWLRWVLLIASLYTLIWVLGYYASLAVRPHCLEVGGMRLRYGTLAYGVIPHEVIAAVARERHNMPKRARGLFVDADTSAAYFGMDGATNVVLRLNSPQSLHGLFAMTKPITTIYLVVDEPARFVSEVQQRIRAAAALPVSTPC